MDGDATAVITLPPCDKRGEDCNLILSLMEPLRSSPDFPVLSSELRSVSIVSLSSEVRL